MAPRLLNAIQFQPETQTCQSLVDTECANEPEWVVEYGSPNANDNYPNLPSYVCTECLPATIDLALEMRASSVELEKHECNSIRVAKYLATNPTIQPDRTIG